MKITFTIIIPDLIVNYFVNAKNNLFPFTFQILLVACIGLSIGGYLSLANEVAIISYYSLVIGFILQFVPFLKNENKKTITERNCE